MMRLHAPVRPAKPTYEELQAQILQSMTVKQDLINARNALDRDLERFRAIQKFSTTAIQLQDPRDLAILTIEAAIEAFEVECGALFIRTEAEPLLRLEAFYGIPSTSTGCTLNEEWIAQHGLERSESAFVEWAGQRDPWSTFGLHQVMVAPFYNSEVGLVGVLACGNSRAKRDYYPELDDDVLPSFMVFTQQAATTMHNLKSRELIREQVRDLQHARDELEQRVAERTAQLSAANRAKTSFLANMSHELRTPMNAVIGFSEMILDGIYGRPNTRIREAVREIQQSGEHLLALINAVLDISKIEAGRMELSLEEQCPAACITTVAGHMSGLARERGLALIVDPSPPLPQCRFDLQRIVQVLLNLVGNAIKFTRSGEIRLGVELGHADARTSEPMVVFRVSDTGIGIAPCDQELIFSAFEQSHTTIAGEGQGSGLGLAISKRFVEMHGGRIWVESAIGTGSTFRFSLPVGGPGQVVP